MKGLDLSALERSLLLGGDVEILLPNWRKAEYGAPLMLGRFLADLKEAAGTLLNIEGVVFFGSSVREPRRMQKRFCWMKWETTEEIDAADIDIAIFLRDGEQRRVDANLHVRADNGFYGYYWKRLNCLHYAAITAETFDAAIAAGDETARRIRDEGVLFAGEPPVEIRSRRKFIKMGNWKVLIE